MLSRLLAFHIGSLTPAMLADPARETAEVHIVSGWLGRRLLGHWLLGRDVGSDGDACGLLLLAIDMGAIQSRAVSCTV